MKVIEFKFLDKVILIEEGEDPDFLQFLKFALENEVCAYSQCKTNFHIPVKPYCDNKLTIINIPKKLRLQ